jgi:hypothetical protein
MAGNAARVDLLERKVEDLAQGGPGWRLGIRPWGIESVRLELPPRR